MIEYSAKAPTIPIPFHRLFKVVALVDSANSQVAALLDRLAEENYEIGDFFSIDARLHPSPDTDVGAPGER